MTGNTVNGSGNGARSGAQTLVLLAAPLNVLILQILSDGPKQQAQLRRETDSPAQTTLRAQLKRLVELGAIEKRRHNRFPGTLEYELTAAGRDLLVVADILERWLDRSPVGPLKLGGGAAKAAIKALAEGWSTTMLRALAAGPMSLTSLDRVIGSVSYPSLERRLGAMRLAGQVEARPGDGRGTPYAVTRWLRQGVAPLAASARWERSHLADISTPIGRLDVEAALLLTVPLLRLPAGLSGTCRIAADIPNGKGPCLAGAMVELQDGDVVSCSTHLKSDADAWILGSPSAWLAAVIDHDTDRLEGGGDRQLTGALVEAIYRSLSGLGRESRLDSGMAIRDDRSN